MLRILVVDDSAVMRKIIMRGLTEAVGDCEFAEAGDGREGLEVLAKGEGIDLILSDVNMPNMNGIEFVRSVRDLKEGDTTYIDGKVLLKQVSNSIPILVLSSENGLRRVNEALAAGANDYLTKPFTPDQLKEKLTPLLAR